MKAAAKACTLAVKVIPGAARNETCGWLGDALKIKLTAPPVEGRANEALCDFLAEKLDLPRRAVSLARGAMSRHKQVRIDGLTLEEAREKLSQ